MRSCSRRNSSLKLLQTGGNPPSDARRFKYHCCLAGYSCRAACVVSHWVGLSPFLKGATCSLSHVVTCTCPAWKVGLKLPGSCGCCIGACTGACTGGSPAQSRSAKR
eukprot:330936-Chlamydomonas_euryale.AAC.1